MGGCIIYIYKKLLQSDLCYIGLTVRPGYHTTPVLLIIYTCICFQ